MAVKIIDVFEIVTVENTYGKGQAFGLAALSMNSSFGSAAVEAITLCSQLSEGAAEMLSCSIAIAYTYLAALLRASRMISSGRLPSAYADFAMRSASACE